MSESYNKITLPVNEHLGLKNIIFCKSDNLTGGEVQLSNIQLEIGSQATAYEPYRETYGETDINGVLKTSAAGPNMTILVFDAYYSRPFDIDCTYYRDNKGSMDSQIKNYVENKILYGSLALADLPEDASIGTIYIQIDESN
jgi:hypothetical protein